MKFSSTTLLSLCVLHPNVWGTTAFLSVRQPQKNTKQQAALAFGTSTTFSTSSSTLYASYLDVLGGEPENGPSPQGPQVTYQTQTQGVPGQEAFYADGPNLAAPSGPTNAAMEQADAQQAPDIWDSTVPGVTVQGGALRTWSFATHAVKRVKVLMKTDGRPLNANLDLWQGPDNAPQKMSVFVEDGSARTFSAVIETPRGQNAIALRNTGHMEFPLSAIVEAEMEDELGNGSCGLVRAINTLADNLAPEIIQGGAIKTYSFDPTVASVQILLKTDGRPLNARIELLQGPNTNKQVVELYTEDGMERPFFAVIETPGVGNVVRIVNTAPVEFPMTARVNPYMLEEAGGTFETGGAGGGWDSGPLLGGGR